MHFEWDPNKAGMNLRKHGISFDEAASGKRNDSMQKQIDPNDYALRNEYDFARMTIVPRGRFAPEREPART